MSRRFLIHLTPDPHAADGIGARWRRLDAETGTQSGLPPGVGEADDVTVLVGGEWTLLLKSPALPGSRSQREQAVAFAIEEQLAAPVESLQIALGEDRGGRAEQLTVIDRALLQRLQQRLGDAGIEADRLLPDVTLLAGNGGAAGLLLDADRALLRLADGSALAGDRSELAQWLPLLASRGLLAGGIDAYSAEAVWPAELPCPEGLRLHALDDSLSWFGERLAAASAPNLLQGEFRPQHRREGQLKPWRWAAALLLAAGVTSLLYALLDHRALSARVEEQQSAMETEYRRLVPDATRVFDPVNQLRSRLSGSPTAGADGLDLVARVAPTFAAANVLPLFAMDYRDGTLEVTLRAGSVSALDDIRQRIGALPGLSAELTSVTPGQGATEGRLRIVRRAGAAS
ncbi:MAG: type II secretion system protein GspL [Lysobacteraceae bacterium]